MRLLVREYMKHWIIIPHAIMLKFMQHSFKIASRPVFNHHVLHLSNWLSIRSTLLLFTCLPTALNFIILFNLIILFFVIGCACYTLWILGWHCCLLSYLFSLLIRSGWSIWITSSFNTLLHVGRIFVLNCFDCRKKHCYFTNIADVTRNITEHKYSMFNPKKVFIIIVLIWKAFTVIIQYVLMSIYRSQFTYAQILFLLYVASFGFGILFKWYKVVRALLKCNLFSIEHQQCSSINFFNHKLKYRW